MMRILFERTGGFAGGKLEGSLDCSTLSRAQFRRLRRLLDKSGFFELPPLLESYGPGADRFSYRVTVESEGRAHTVEADEAAIPDPMRPLLDFLATALSRK
jgi:hypothetical protein